MTQAPPDHVTRPLLARITESSLDQDYEAAAARRAGSGPQRPTRTIALAFVVFGLLVGISVMQTTRQADSASAGRAALLTQIAQGRGELADQQAKLDVLRGEINQLSAELGQVAAAEGIAAGRAKRLGAVTGFSAVRGPGLLLTVTDGRGDDPSTLVRSRDLATLLDALWNAGAEAVTINDQRITTTTSLHDSGSSVGVGTVTLSSPYRVRAIGDPRTLSARLQESTHGLAWTNLVAQLGFGFTAEAQRGMLLSAAPERVLRQVEAIDQERTKSQEPRG